MVNVGGQNLLLIHGLGGLRGGLEKAINQIMGRYASKGIEVDYVIFGHVHSARVGDNYGKNTYC